MSKMFFKGRIETRENYVVSGYNVNRDVKAGSKESPISLTLKSELRKSEVEAVLSEHSIFADIVVDPKREENTLALDTLLNKPVTTTFENKPKRNDPCSCGSGKKYKKCCG